MPEPFLLYCDVCNAALSSITSAKSARSCRDRHKREAHGHGALRWRREQNKKRQSSYRRARRTVQKTATQTLRAYVLRPLRRERLLCLFAGARNSLVDVGIGISAVRRLQGVALALQRRRDGVPTAAATVLRAVLQDFLPRTRAVFTVNQQVRYVLFVEDDCRLVSGVRLSDILSAARRARSRIAWLGYGMRRGEPKVGAHLVCFCRVALARFRTDAADADPRGTLAFDTLLRKLWRLGRAWAPSETLAAQARRPLKGRR